MRATILLLITFKSIFLSESSVIYRKRTGTRSAWGYSGPIWTPSHPFRTPLEEMVDVTNNLGVAILKDYSFSGRNFAFSPYGVASVLVVLLEGARRDSARQILEGAGFPLDKDIIRIGFRDLHKQLKSYFKHEGYLSGITLSKQGTSVKPEYKRILKFYGYEVDAEAEGVNSFYEVSSAPPPNFSSPVSGNNSSLLETTLKSNISDLTTTEKNVNLNTDSTTKVNIFDKTSTTRNEETTTTTQEPSAATNEVTSNIVATTILAENNLTDSNDLAETEEQTLKTSTTRNEVTTFFPSTTTQELSAATSEVTSNIVTTTMLADSNDLTETEEQTLKTSTTRNEVTTFFPSTTTQELSAATSEVTSNIVTTTVLADSNDLAETEEQTSKTSTFPNIEYVETTVNHVFFSLTESPETDSTTTAENTHSLMVDGDLKTTTVFSNEKKPEEVENKITTTTLKPNTETEESTQNLLTETTTKFLFFATEESPLINRPQHQHVESLTSITPLDSDTLTPTTTPVQNLITSEISPQTTHSTHNESSWPGNDTYSLLLILDDEDKKRQVMLPKKKGNGKSVGYPSILLQEKGGSKRRRAKSRRLNVKLICRDCGSKKATQEAEVTDFINVSDSIESKSVHHSRPSRTYDFSRTLPRGPFFVDGVTLTSVPVMTYTNIFPFAYIPKLRSKALEFPLDDVRYKLLLLCPEERRGLTKLIEELESFGLRQVVETLRPSRVKITIPSFSVGGVVCLSSSLRKMGIVDVFHPGKSDLSGMSTDPELYVRNVEQSVKVVIKNYVELLDTGPRTEMGRSWREREFQVWHPFVYFVLDSETDVALMAGYVVDPLNPTLY